MRLFTAQNGMWRHRAYRHLTLLGFSETKNNDDVQFF